ncbi:hypothetical protein GCM10010347_55750 [Streptomyces cirratus]|uniref:Uncharacterized protein n=1 Tax=Streptomyces cirratus TaxID=68187 RepID=A0ABQ3EZZ7_9ACTN|nr:hypothetical protein GCM10010347_55750 [Streptomyces cirratus]
MTAAVTTTAAAATMATVFVEYGLLARAADWVTVWGWAHGWAAGGVWWPACGYP